MFAQELAINYLNRFVKDGVQHSVFRFPYNDYYSINLKKKSDDGVELKVSKQAPDFFDAVVAAGDAFYQTVNEGSRKLIAPQLEHQPPSPTKDDFDDEVPF